MRSRVGCTAPAAVGVLAFFAACSAGGAPATAPSIDAGSHALPPVAPPIAHVDNAYVLASKVALPATKPNDSATLHNVFQLSSHLISGGEPHGEEAFRQLAAMGVKTIISVDGKMPESELAAKYGMRYVHIPIEYKGISDEELVQLVKTFRECEGPFYAHCFHGKHRGPAAAAVGRLTLDGASREEAIAEMRQWSGTAPEYEGLYRDVATKLIPTEAQTRAYAFDFPPTRSFGGFREAMIDISRREDSIKRSAAHEWAADPTHPDVDLVHEAATLADQLRIGGTLAEIADRPADFHDRLELAAQQALRFEDAVTAVRRGDAGAADAAKKRWAELSNTCTGCHATYRNK